MQILRRALSCACAVLLLFTSPAFAWNATGHRIIAAIAYERLTPAVRAKVDELIRNHPDYQMFVKDAPQEPAARARAAFLFASTWPDVIRGDSRFYDETRADAMPTPLQPGFPDMMRHGTWHYQDSPFSQDGTPGKPTAAPNALTELRRLMAEIGKTGTLQATYDLPWLEHIASDVHQPLHATSRFSTTLLEGDAGGNRVYVTDGENKVGKNLHAYWDGAAGNDSSDEYVTRYARQVVEEFPAPANLSLDPQQWLDESFGLDKSDVYTFGLANGSKENPIVLPAGYSEKTNRIARQRISYAGFRLAAVLNEQLR